MKVAAEWTWRSGGGSLFHARGPATANDRSPNDDVVRGTATAPEAADLSDRLCQLKLQMLWSDQPSRQVHLRINSGEPSYTSMGCHLPYGITKYCHPTQMNTPHLNPSHSGWYLIYLPRRDGMLIWPRRPVTHQDGLPAHRPIQGLIRQCMARSRTCNLLVTSLMP